MSNIIFRGDAPAVAQLNTVTPSVPAVGNIFTLTCNGKAISFTATATTVANVTAGIAAAVAASTIAEFAEVTVTDNTTNVLITANTAGMPFVITSSAAAGSGGGSPTFTTALTTVSTGPNDLSTALNYTGGSLPGGSDTLYFKGAVNAFWGLDALAAVAPTIIYDDDFTGAVGLPDYNANGYYEYRQKFLQCVSTSVTNRSRGTRIRMDFLTTASVVFNQLSCGNPSGTDTYAVNIKGTGASSTLTIQQGAVALALGAGETTTFSTITIGSLQSPASDVTLWGGTGLAWTTVNQNGGTVTLNSNGTTLTQNTQAVATIRGAATVTTITINPGCVVHDQSSGTKATVNVNGAGAVVDNSQNPVAKTYTNVNLNAGGSILDPYAKVTFTNPIALARGVGLEDVTLELGKNRNVQVS